MANPTVEIDVAAFDAAAVSQRVGTDNSVHASYDFSRSAGTDTVQLPIEAYQVYSVITDPGHYRAVCDYTCIGAADMTRLLGIQCANLMPKESWKERIAVLQACKAWPELQEVIAGVNITGGKIFPFGDYLTHDTLVAYPFRDMNDSTPLMWACSMEKMVKGVKDEWEDEFGMYHRADDTLALRILESPFAQVDVVSHTTALIEASRHGLTKVALQILDTGSGRPDYIDNFGNTALIYACMDGWKEVALRILETGQGRPDHVGSEGYTALMWACSFGTRSVALRILETGQGRPEHVNDRGNTALNQAIKSDHLRAVALRILEIL